MSCPIILAYDTRQWIIGNLHNMTLAGCVRTGKRLAGGWGSPSTPPPTGWHPSLHLVEAFPLWFLFITCPKNLLQSLRSDVLPTFKALLLPLMTGHGMAGLNRFNLPTQLKLLLFSSHCDRITWLEVCWAPSDVWKAKSFDLPSLSVCPLDSLRVTCEMACGVYCH